MAQAHPSPSTMHHAHRQSCHNLTPTSPVSLVRELNKKHQQFGVLNSISSSFYGSCVNAKLMKRQQLRQLPTSLTCRVAESHLCRVDPPWKPQIDGNISWSLASSGSHVVMANFRRSNPLTKQGRCNAVAHAQAVHRSFSLLPGAGPLRDFLFALIGAVFAFLFAGFLARLWSLEERYFRATSAERGNATMPEMGSNQGQKESVEWVNMVIHKVWKVYRRSLQVWLVQLLQPAIDNLGKPNWVKRVKIVELNLDYEPIIVRNVQRRASRRANDLQYHFGLRYAGGARCLLNLKLGRAGFETFIPVGVYELDVDAELWVKLRLAPVKPYVGTLSLAFVRLPTIKLVLAPFRVVNLFSIPFLNNFLSKLLTVDLPRLLVLPRHITFDFLPQGQNVMDSMEAMEASVESGAMDDSIASGVLDLLKTAYTEPAVPQNDPSEAFVGELSVTICDARGLPIRGFTGWSNPYCILTLGDQVLESKRNKETSQPSGPKDPVWNQDFLLLVEDPRRQRLMLRVRDSTMTLNPNIGYCYVNLAELRDCVPRTMWLNLRRDGMFGPKKVPGRVRVTLTFKSYVDGEEGVDDNAGSFSPYIKVYKDSGAETVEDIGVSLGEEIAASVEGNAKRTEYESDVEADISQTQRKDSSVAISSSPRDKGKPIANGNARASGSNRSAAETQASQDQFRARTATEAVQQGNGSARRGEQAEPNSTHSSNINTSENAPSYPSIFSSDGDIRVPRGVKDSVQGKYTSIPADRRDSNVERLTRSSEIHDSLRVDLSETHARRQSMYEEASGAPGMEHKATEPSSESSNPKEEGSQLEDEAGIASKGDASKAEGNKLLWLCMFTTVAYVIGWSLHFSNPLHP